MIAAIRRCILIVRHLRRLLHLWPPPPRTWRFLQEDALANPPAPRIIGARSVRVPPRDTASRHF